MASQDMYTIYNVMIHHALQSKDIDLQLTLGVPPRKLQIDKDFETHLNHVIAIQDKIRYKVVVQHLLSEQTIQRIAEEIADGIIELLAARNLI